MERTSNSELSIVQQRDTLVPSSLESEKAGSHESSASERCTQENGHLTSGASNTTGVRREKQAAKAFYVYSEKLKVLVGFVLSRNNIHKEIRTLAKAASRTLTDYAKLRQSER